MNEKKREILKELKEDVWIDKDDLEDECCRQSFLYMKWAARLAQAEENVRRTELELTRFKATVLIEEKQGTRKSDVAAQSVYRTREEYNKLNKRISLLQKKADFLKYAVYAMNNRKSMIESLTRLKTAEYFNG